MSDSYGNIIPQRFVLPQKATKYDQTIVVNWLQTEVPQKKDMPILKHLTRWRNKEVFYFVRYVWPDWTVGACQ